MQIFCGVYVLYVIFSFFWNRRPHLSVVCVRALQRAGQSICLMFSGFNIGFSLCLQYLVCHSCTDKVIAMFPSAPPLTPGHTPSPPNPFYPWNYPPLPWPAFTPGFTSPLLSPCDTCLVSSDSRKKSFYGPVAQCQDAGADYQKTGDRKLSEETGLVVD